ncbi:GerMN domain-containing protein [Psychromicrobium xiongbiense]|uniref:GerMN domain-containing protein n=1 Tax=Psychromicrobium xiongbiense TaxID=3051184 RepID=UPI00255288DB|nr:GerMN domain-containing protein [Psychromicrobium sp. YIM S02556]
MSILAVFSTLALACSLAACTATTPAVSSNSAPVVVTGTQASNAPQESTQAAPIVPVYWIGRSDGAKVLYREFLPLAPGADPIKTAIEKMTGSKPLDPDYSTPWSKASKVTASISASGGITVDLSADAFNTSLDESTARLALQQLVYTATAAATNAGLLDTGTNIPVSVLVDGHTGFLAFDRVKLDGPLIRDRTAPAPLWIINPQQGQQYKGRPQTLTGRTTNTSGPVSWSVVARDTSAIIQTGTAPAADPTTGSFTITLTLPPGSYRLEMFWTSADSPTTKHGLDTKDFTVV